MNEQKIEKINDGAIDPSNQNNSSNSQISMKLNTPTFSGDHSTFLKFLIASQAL